MGSKKGQAAMEFLMTYGWAILVVLAAVGALAYFGVLNPSRFLPEKCQFPSGLACLGHKASSVDSEAIIVMKNSMGNDLINVSVQLVTKTGTGYTPMTKCPTPSSDQDLPNSVEGKFNMTCAGLTPGERLQGDVQIKYTVLETGIPYTKYGEFITKVE